MSQVTQITGILISAISAIAAVVSILFAWKAVKTSERSNTGGLIVELHKLYHSDKILRATQICWDMFSPYQETAGNIPLSHQKASDFAKNKDRSSVEWKAVHDLSSFWRYVALLVRKGFMDEDVAFSAFTSADILGFLWPIEKAFAKNYVYDKSLDVCMIVGNNGRNRICGLTLRVADPASPEGKRRDLPNFAIIKAAFDAKTPCG